VCQGRRNKTELTFSTFYQPTSVFALRRDVVFIIFRDGSERKPAGTGLVVPAPVFRILRAKRYRSHTPELGFSVSSFFFFPGSSFNNQHAFLSILSYGFAIVGAVSSECSRFRDILANESSGSLSINALKKCLVCVDEYLLMELDGVRKSVLKTLPIHVSDQAVFYLGTVLFSL